MALYEELAKMDIVGPIIGLINEKTIWLDEEDWKLHYGTHTLSSSPWFYSLFDSQRDCTRDQFYFKHYGFIPKECRLCWKVSCKLTTVKNLIKLKDLQLEMNLSSKCGVEEESNRWASRKGGLYSGFWYAKIEDTMLEGMKGAMKLRDVVREELVKVFGKSMTAKVKRGCTEMERKFGDSKGWDRIAKEALWDVKEEFLDSLFVHDGMKFQVMERLAYEHSSFGGFKIMEWIRFAAMQGDMTYLEFVDAPFASELRVYDKEDAGGTRIESIS